MAAENNLRSRISWKFSATNDLSVSCLAALPANLVPNSAMISDKSDTLHSVPLVGACSPRVAVVIVPFPYSVCLSSWLANRVVDSSIPSPSPRPANGHVGCLIVLPILAGWAAQTSPTYGVYIVANKRLDSNIWTNAASSIGYCGMINWPTPHNESSFWSK